MIAVLLIMASLAAGYALVTMLAGVFRTRTLRSNAFTTRFAILIPAHNEELSMPRTLQSLGQLDYPRECVRVYVVADNCSDGTAAVARQQGADVIERHDEARRGKGYALEFALQQILPTLPDVVLIFDADGELEADALRVFDARFATGTEAVQGSIRTRNAGDSPGSFVAAVGNVMDDRVSAGRCVLGLRVPLRGSNMAFRREVLERLPWQSYGLTEDAEYADRLAVAGVRIRFEPAARAMSESAGDTAALCQQRRRWRASLTTLPKWLDSKPVVLLQLAITTAMVLLLNVREYAWWLMVIWIITILMYLHAIITVGTTPFRHVIAIPGIIVRLAAVSLAGLFRRETVWRRTPRLAERSSGALP